MTPEEFIEKCIYPWTNADANGAVMVEPIWGVTNGEGVEIEFSDGTVLTVEVTTND